MKNKMLLEKKEVNRFAKLAGVTLTESYLNGLQEEEEKEDKDLPADEGGDMDLPPAPEGGDNELDLGGDDVPPTDDKAPQPTEDMPETSDLAKVPLEPGQVADLVSAITDAIREVTGVDVGVEEGEPDGDEAGPDLDGDGDGVPPMPPPPAPEGEGKEGEEKDEDDLDEMLQEATRRAIKKGNLKAAHNLKALRRQILSENTQKKTPVAPKPAGKVQLNEALVRRVARRVAQRIANQYKIKPTAKK